MRDLVSTPFKVLYLIGSLYYGGAQTQLIELATHLDNQRFRPTVGVLRSNHQGSGLLQQRGIPVIHFRRRMKYDPTAVFRIARFLRSHRISVLHSWMFSAGAIGQLAAFIARTPIVVHTERLVPLQYSESGSKPGRSLRDRLINGLIKARADAIVANSDSLGRYLELVEGYDKAKIRVIHNGLNLNRVTPGPEARDGVRR